MNNGTHKRTYISDTKDKEGETVALTPEEKKILQVLQGDIPLNGRPFASLGKSLNMREDEVIRIIKRLTNEGVLRKFGAILRHRQAGFTQNAMVVWSVPESRIEIAGKILASFPEVSHCYERSPAFEGKYNIFTMVHLKTLDIPLQIRQMAEAVNLDDYQILISAIEYKKSSMVYFGNKDLEND